MSDAPPIESCSFCRKTKREVRVLIAAPNVAPPVAICDECNGLCVDLIQECLKEQEAAESAREEVP